ncbi:hypothetical protein C7H19_21025 [Aphanothece hegewaldii CCALA 016]|uniref:Vitamin K epoxide reductase domain-containing protein n=2 Tax=Aphanothece TaxID=1121 RepID=A0A2T1LSK3_9CHRO|nr:hypothetical protein C7H19_21025 [Aphanothece hegewaldii CCALA 016]
MKLKETASQIQHTWTLVKPSILKHDRTTQAQKFDYFSMIVFAVAPLFFNTLEQKKLHSNLNKWTRLFLFMGSTAMMVFSGYLMYLLFAVIKAACLYCIVSALLSTSLFILSIIGHDWEEVGQLWFIGIIVGIIVLVGTLGMYAPINNPRAEKTPGGYDITTVSGTAEIALAQHLKQVGAKMYGAFWCPHCHDQKQLFGKEAVAQINYIECDPRGKDPKPELCQAAKIQGFPSWEIKGKFYQGTQSLEQLANLSAYQGQRNFQNNLSPK